ncbi:MAG: DUF6883 domain-containing protein, partial [Cyanobacteria bacterium J06592_8]
MKLPNGDQAEIPLQKLIGYCLNSEHPSGKHKARVFASVLGITRENAEQLQELIKIAAVEGEVVQQNTTPFGQQFKVCRSFVMLMKPIIIDTNILFS